MATRTRSKKTNPTPPAADEQVVVKFRGQTFTCPKSRSQWPTRAHQAFQRRNNADGIELLLGPQQWERLNEVGPTMADFWEFFAEFTAVANAGLVPDKDDESDSAEADADGTED